MQADEAAELMESEREQSVFKRRAAVTIAFFAMLLAITGLGGSNAGKDVILSNILASDTYAFYQSKNIRQVSTELAADALEAIVAGMPDMPAAARQQADARIAQYRVWVANYESDPRTNEGKRELLAKARAHEEVRDHAMAQDPYFDYAEALLQIAIVLISVSIVAEQVWLSFVGGALGLAGAFLMLDGFTLLVPVPGLA